MSITPRSGSSYFLSYGGYEASISSIGASLRELTHQGRHLVHTFDMDEVRPAYKGATLAPWPNRIIDGRYRIDGQELQLPSPSPSGGTPCTALPSGSTSFQKTLAPISPYFSPRSSRRPDTRSASKFAPPTGSAKTV